MFIITITLMDSLSPDYSQVSSREYIGKCATWLGKDVYIEVFSKEEDGLCKKSVGYGL